jgi:hypothetical protein
MTMIVRPAAREDVTVIEQLLDGSHLPRGGVVERLADTVVAARGLPSWGQRRWNRTKTACCETIQSSLPSAPAHTRLMI